MRSFHDCIRLLIDLHLFIWSIAESNIFSIEYQSLYFIGIFSILPDVGVEYQEYQEYQRLLELLRNTWNTKD